MHFPMMIECVYEGGAVLFTYSPKYMRTLLGRPVRVVVHGQTSAADRHAIKNSAHQTAHIEYKNPVKECLDGNA